LNAQTIEIGSEAAGLSIALIKRAIPYKLNSQEYLNPRRGGADDVVDAFRVKITAKPLEVRRQQSGISVVDLLRCVAPAPCGATDRSVCGLNLVEGGSSLIAPIG
jgi:hypothetical protein